MANGKFLKQEANKFKTGFWINARHTPILFALSVIFPVITIYLIGFQFYSQILIISTVALLMSNITDLGLKRIIVKIAYEQNLQDKSEIPNYILIAFIIRLAFGTVLCIISYYWDYFNLLTNINVTSFELKYIKIFIICRILYYPFTTALVEKASVNLNVKLPLLFNYIRHFSKILSVIICFSNGFSVINYFLSLFIFDFLTLLYHWRHWTKIIENRYLRLKFSIIKNERCFVLNTILMYFCNKYLFSNFLILIYSTIHNHNEREKAICLILYNIYGNINTVIAAPLARLNTQIGTIYKTLSTTNHGNLKKLYKNILLKKIIINFIITILFTITSFYIYRAVYKISLIPDYKWMYYLVAIFCIFNVFNTGFNYYIISGSRSVRRFVFCAFFITFVLFYFYSEHIPSISYILFYIVFIRGFMWIWHEIIFFNRFKNYENLQ